MAFPTSDMPGHVRLRERVEAALDRAMETPSVDFKESASWTTLKWKVVKTVLGMGNLRDGGLIVIGVSERRSTWKLEGISARSRATFDADAMAAMFDKYVSPAPAVEVVLHERASKHYLVLDIGEFEEIPFVCKRNGPAGEGLEQGSFYHRPLGGVPRTEKVNSAEDLRPILQVAAEKGARRIVADSMQIGLIGSATPPEPSDEDLYEAELGNI